MIDEVFRDFVWNGRRLADRRDVVVTLADDHALSIFRSRAWERWRESGARGPICVRFTDFDTNCYYFMAWDRDEGSNPKLPLLRIELQGARSLERGETTSAHLLGRLVHYVRDEFQPVDWSDGNALGRLARDLALVRRSLRLDEESVAARLGISRDWLVKWESGAIPSSYPPSDTDPHVFTVIAWARALGLLAKAGVPLVKIVPDVTPHLVTFLKEDPGRLSQLTPAQFEIVVAERLDRMGYQVTLTGHTMRKDGGVDLIAVPRNAGVGTFLLAAQVKHHRGNDKTGREAVDRLLSLKNGVFRLGLLVTNTAFTADAQWAAALGDNRFFLRLRDIEDIKRWLEDDFRSEREFREIPDEVELAPGVRIQIPKPRLDGPGGRLIWPI